MTISESETKPGETKKHPRKPRRSIGRPKVETVRDHYITIRVTAIEHFQFLDKARRSGVTPSAYGRSRILRGIARRKKTTASAAEQIWLDDVTPLVEAILKAWHELHKIGVNLNQIAHHCNRHQQPPPAQFHLLVAELLTLLQRLTRP